MTTSEFAPGKAFLPVSQFNFRAFSRLALHKGYAGIAGHYLLLGNRMQRTHERAGQHIGIGYPCSKNSLFREANRGVAWIFSNHAVEMQRIVDAYIRSGAM